VPGAVVFRTKPQLALEMVTDAVAAGVPFRWVGGDSVYGDNPTFVSGVRDLGKWYVVDVSSDAHVWTEEPTVIPADERPRPTRGRTPTRPRVIGTSRRVDEVVAALPASAWRRVIVGEGSQGPRWYEYAEVPVWFREEKVPGPAERLLARRSLGQTAEVKYHRSNAPAVIPLAKLATVRGLRWTVEEDIQTGKGECGLDEYETRGWVGWHRHPALSLLALTFLVLQKRRLGEKTRRPDGARGAGGVDPPAGRAGVGRRRDPEVVPVATRAKPAGGGKPPQTPPRRSATTK
jgi:SRSO17 transposase